MIVTTFIRWFAQAASRKARSSSRPKTSLPVMGNLATEVFLGPSLAGGVRVPAREAAGGILFKSSRVILRRASIAPVIVGIVAAAGNQTNDLLFYFCDV